MTQPTLSHEAFNAQVIDYLDGLLSDEARQTFELTMKQQPEWAQDVHTLERTWRQARQVIKASERPAPSRVKQHVLAEAAKRAAVLRSQAGKVTASSGAPSPGLFERLRKLLFGRPWFVPAFVTAAAVGLYVFSQKNFETTRARNVGQSLDQLQEAPPVSAVPTQAEEVTEPEAERDEGLADEAPKKKVARAVPQREHKGASSQAKRRSAGVASGERADSDSVLGGVQNEGYAQPPSGWAGGGVAAKAEAPKEEHKEDRKEERAEGELSRGRAVANAPTPAARPPSAPTAAPAPSTSAGASMKASERAVMPVPQEALDTEDDRVELAPSSRWAGTSQDALLARVVRAESNAQWPLVIELYKELLRRYPQHKQAPAWKKALARAEQAVE